MSDIRVKKQLLPGVILLQCPRYNDPRGDFIKVYHDDSMTTIDLPFKPAESFITRSKKGVIRGMHFQIEESAHDKLVYCPKGRVLDVVVDVRPQSPQFNKPIAVELSDANNHSLFISKGYAHGFLSLEDDSWMMYFTTTIHNPSLDRGVLWSSIDFDWPVAAPLVSERDQTHPVIESLR